MSRTRRRLAPRVLAALLLLVAAGPRTPDLAAQRVAASRYDPAFRKYSKRFFGVGFDWQYFKAQGLAESGLDPHARSRVGARGIMQLMPGTYDLIRHNRRERMGSIEDPESNIAAAILHDRDLWTSLSEHPDAERMRFTFGAYNAGEGTIARAKGVARADRLDYRSWQSIERVAPKVQRWRYTETLPYVRKIEDNYQALRQQPRRGNARTR